MASHRRPAALVAFGSGLTLGFSGLDGFVGLGPDAVALVQVAGSLFSIVGGLWLAAVFVAALTDGSDADSA